MEMRFDSKDAARHHVWDALESEKVARFPFPPHGRILDFDGAAEAADRLFELDLWKDVQRIKVNPDAPQRPVRQRALQRGIEVYMPTPRLNGGFNHLDPDRIPEEHHKDAAALTKADDYAQDVAVHDLPQIALIVAGNVAVTRGGHRAGKGEGYSDIEYGLLRELGHDPAPVVTTVHPLQLVDALPSDPNDLPLSAIATPTRTYIVKDPPPPPSGIDWDVLSDDDLDAMPILRELKQGRSP